MTVSRDAAFRSAPRQSRAQTWTDVQETLRRTYRLAQDRPEWAGLVCDLGADSVPRPQRVKLELIRAFGEDWLLIMAVACPLGVVPHEIAMRRNQELAVGSLAIAHDSLVVRHTLRLVSLTSAELERAIQAVASEALRLRESQRSNGSLHASFAE